MKQQEVNRLKALYKLGELDQTDWKQLEKAIEEGHISPDELDELDTFQNTIRKMPSEQTPLHIKDELIEMITREKNEIHQSRNANKRELYIRWSLAAAAMMAGVILGIVLPYAKSKKVQSTEIVSLQKEVHDLRETMMLTLLKNDAPTERLKAVSYSEEFETQNRTVTEALINTLNEDENINVRLAAIDALHKYTDDAWVRAQLVKSIGNQESPLVQIALAECMVTLKEKASIQALRTVIEKKTTPDPVKRRIEGYIKQI